MRLVLIGRSGQVATELQRLFELRYRTPAGSSKGVKASSDLSAEAGENVSLTILSRPEVDLASPDLATDALAETLRTTGADVIINAAAYTAVDQAESKETLARAINAEAPAAMARVAAERGIPFLQVSTDYVYDGSGDAPWQPDSPADPLGAYGRTKLAGDLGVIAAGGPHAVLRTSWVFSAHGGNFVKTMLRLGRTRDTLNVVSDQIGGPTPATDIASALLTMAESFLSYRPSGYLRTGLSYRAGHSSSEAMASQTPHPSWGDGSPPCGIYHLSGTPDTSWADFAREIFRQTAIECAVEDIPTSAYPTPAKRPANSRLDCTSLTTTFGIQRPDWRDGLQAVLQELEAARRPAPLC